MKTISVFTLLALSLTISISLSDIEMGTKRIPHPSPVGGGSPIFDAKKTACVILIDPTLALEEAGFKQMARSVYRIAKALPENSIIEVRQIDDDPYLAPVVNYTVPPRPSSPPSAIRAYPVKVENGAKSLGQKVFLHLQDIRKQTPDTRPKSCMVRGLQTAYSFLKHYPQSSYHWEVVVISDMVEQCDNSPIGKLFFTPKGFANASQRIASYQADFDMSYANLSVQVVKDYQPGNPDYLHPDKLRGLWDGVFEKVGYSQAQIANMYFGPTLPPRFQVSASR